MTLSWRIISGIILLFSALGLLPSMADTVPLPRKSGSSNKVFYMPQFSEFEAISDGEMHFFRKTLQRAEKERAAALILEMDTPGGNVETAFKYLSIMEKTSIPIVVYLNPNGISAGMIIAMGADRAAISPHGLIGDAMPIAMGISGVKPVTEKPDDSKNKKSVEEKKEIVFEKIIREAVSPVESFIKRAKVFLEDGKWKEADEYCEKVLDMDGNSG